MKTIRENLQATVYVFAKPKTEWELSRSEPNELPWKYEVKAYDYGDESCVRIMEHEILVPIPAGIDVTTECIANLKEKINAIEKQAKADIDDLHERIRALALIEYKPESVVLDASEGPDWGAGPAGTTEDVA